MGRELVEYVTVLSGTSSVQARLQHAMSLRTEDVQPRWADCRDLLSGVMLRSTGVPLDVRLDGYDASHRSAEVKSTMDTYLHPDGPYRLPGVEWVSTECPAWRYADVLQEDA